MGTSDYRLFVSPYGRKYFQSIVAHDLPLDRAVIAGISVASFLYLWYLWLCRAVWRLRRKQSETASIVSWALVLLLVLTTIEYIIGLCDVIDSFVFHSEDAVAYHLRSGHVIFNIQTELAFMINGIAMSLLIWRAYVVWGRNKYIIILPVLGDIGATISSLLVVAMEVVSFKKPTKYLQTYFNCMTAYLAISVWQYVFTSALIIGRIWWQRRRVTLRQEETVKMARTFTYAIIESGALSSVLIILFLAFWNEGYHGVIYLFVYTYPVATAMISTFIVYRLHSVIGHPRHAQVNPSPPPRMYRFTAKTLPEFVPVVPPRPTAITIKTEKVSRLTREGSSKYKWASIHPIDTFSTTSSFGGIQVTTCVEVNERDTWNLPRLPDMFPTDVEKQGGPEKWDDLWSSTSGSAEGASVNSFETKPSSEEEYLSHVVFSPNHTRI